MTGRYKCDVCGWSGDEPATYDPYNDGGVPVCPKGCLEQGGDFDGEPASVFLNAAHPAVQRMILRAMSADYKGGVGG